LIPETVVELERGISREVKVPPLSR